MGDLLMEELLSHLISYDWSEISSTDSRRMAEFLWGYFHLVDIVAGSKRSMKSFHDSYLRPIFFVSRVPGVRRILDGRRKVY